MMATSGRHALGALLVVFSAVLWGTTGTIQDLLPDNRDPFVVAAIRLLVGALTLMALACIAERGWPAFRGLPLRAIVAAGVLIGAYNILFFNAVIGAGVGIGTALAIGSAPVWVTLHEIAAERRLPTGRRLAGQAVCIAGAVLLVVSGSAAPAAPLGMALALLAGMAYAAYSVITGRIGALAPTTTIAAATFGVAAIASAPVLVVFPLGWALSPAAAPGLLFLGVVVTGLSYALYTAGLRHVAASTAVTLALAEPLTAWILATAVVGEANTPARIAGASLLLGGLLVVARTAPGRQPR